MEKLSWKLIEHDGVMRETMEQIYEGRGEQVESYYESYDEFGEVERHAENQTNDEIEISDIIPDALLCQEMKRLFYKYQNEYVNQSKQEIELLIQYNYLIKEYIYCRKRILSAIYRTKTYKQEEESRNYLVDALIQDCRRHITSSELRERYSVLFQDAILEKILNKIQEKLDEGKVPYYWLEKLVKELDGTVAERRKLVKLLQESLKYQPSREQPLTIQMVMNSSLYEDYTNNAKQIHIENTEEMLNSFIPMSVEQPQEFTDRIEMMRVYVNKCSDEDPQRQIFKDHCDTGKSCYGLLQHGTTDYFALSGSFDFEEEEIGQYYQFSGKKLREYEATKRNVLVLHTNFYPAAIWARLRLTTKRYPYQGDRGSGIPTDGESFSEAMNRVFDEDYVTGVKCDFTCCERKIFDYVSGDEGETFLFSKFRPCKKCRPAIRKFRVMEPNMRVFYLGENGIEEWFDQGENRELELDEEYKIIKERLKSNALQGAII